MVTGYEILTERFSERGCAREMWRGTDWIQRKCYKGFGRCRFRLQRFISQRKNILEKHCFDSLGIRVIRLRDVWRLPVAAIGIRLVPWGRC